MLCLEVSASADLPKKLYSLLSISQESMGLYSSIVRHNGILENVHYFKYNDKMLHQVGFVLTMILRIVASLPMQGEKKKTNKPTPKKLPKACSICSWNFVALQSTFKKPLTWTDQQEDTLHSTSRYCQTLSWKTFFINWRREVSIRYIFTISYYALGFFRNIFFRIKLICLISFLWKLRPTQSSYEGVVCCWLTLALKWNTHHLHRMQRGPVGLRNVLPILEFLSMERWWTLQN